MSLPKKTPGNSSLPLELAEVFARCRMLGFTVTDPTQPIGLLAEDDGTLRTQSILFHSGTTQIRQRAETNGAAIASVHGTAPTDGVVGAKVEDTTHEWTASLYGAFSGSAVPVQVDPADGSLHVFVTNTESLAEQLATSTPAAATDTILYTVPGGMDATIQKLVVVNRANTAGRWRLAIVLGGGAPTTADYLWFDQRLTGRTTALFQFSHLPFDITAADEVRIEATTANFTFSIWGEEF